MESTEMETSNPGQSVQDLSSASAQEQNSTSRRKTASTKGKSPLKGTSEKSKKKRKKVQRTTRPNYTVQEGEDMLLIISNISSGDSIWKPKRKGCKKKKTNLKGKSKISPKQTRKIPAKIKAPAVREETVDKRVRIESMHDGFDHQWGQSLPIEILVKIFQFAVLQDGAVPFLCRVGRVCNLWNRAASSPILWRSVSIGYCWIEPGKSQLPATEQKIKNTIDWLAQNRFSQMRDFSLCHWKKHVDFVIERVSQSCPNLHSVKLSYCTGLTEKTFQFLGAGCLSLENINVQHSEFHVDGLVSFLETYGSQIKSIYFTHSTKSDKLLSTLYKGCCPELRLLEINTKIDGGYCQLPICIQALQIGCPKLQVEKCLGDEMAVGGSKVSSIQPYQFEPESDPEQDDAPEEVRQSRLNQDVSEWCLCANCVQMPTEEENKCCREMPQVLRRMQQVENPPQCMVDHPGLEPVCLNVYSLQNALNIYKADYGRLGIKGYQARCRFLAFRSFISWCWGILGRRNRVVLPSCVVQQIVLEFPNVEGQYEGFRPPLD